MTENKVMVAGEKFLKFVEVKEKVGLGKSTIYGLIKKNQFPDNYHITTRRVVWLQSEIEAWMSTAINQKTTTQYCN